MDQSNISTPAVNQNNSGALLGELDNLFNDLQGLLAPKSDTSKLNLGMAAQAAINETGDLEKNVEYVAQKDGLRQELSTLQQREESRMNQVRQQNVLLELRKEKLTGTDGNTRVLDNAGQVRAQKKNMGQGAALEDQSLSEEKLYIDSLINTDDIERSEKTSPDFGEAFLGSSRNATTQKEEQHIRDDYETRYDDVSEPVRRSMPLQQDEILELDKLDQLFGEQLHTVLNDESEIEGRIMAISDHIDRKNGSTPSLVREIEKRIERIGQFIDNKPSQSQTKPMMGKAFTVPTSKSVQRLRNKFGKMYQPLRH
jgi:hypothetical protein